MACTKQASCTYSAGEKGRNRVRVFSDPKTGMYQIQWSEGGRRRQRSLKHRDLSRAKQQADEVAAGLASYQPPEHAPLTLRTLFEMYLDEVTPTKGPYTQKHDRRAVRLFVAFFGNDRAVASLNRRDWDAFIDARRSGREAPSASVRAGLLASGRSAGDPSRDAHPGRPERSRRQSWGPALRPRAGQIREFLYR